MAVITHEVRYQAGFTLIEVLVALAIFSVMAAGMIATEQYAFRQSQLIENKTLALIVAENRLSEIRAQRGWPAIGISDDKISMAGRNWHLNIRIEETPRLDMRKITVAVYFDAAFYVSLTGYIGKN